MNGVDPDVEWMAEDARLRVVNPLLIRTDSPFSSNPL
jgi:hypothetical protein